MVLYFVVFLLCIIYFSLLIDFADSFQGFFFRRAKIWNIQIMDLILGKQIMVSFLSEAWVINSRLDQALKLYHISSIHRQTLWVFKHFCRRYGNHYIRKILFIAATFILDICFNSNSFDCYLFWIATFWLLNSVGERTVYIYFPNTKMGKC